MSVQNEKKRISICHEMMSAQNSMAQTFNFEQEMHKLSCLNADLDFVTF